MIVSKACFVELYQQRRQLQERNEALERLLRHNETMMAVLTRDARPPLSAITMSAEVLKLRRSTRCSASAPIASAPAAAAWHA